MSRYTHSDFSSNFYTRCMAGYVDFKGRSPRFDYWMFSLVVSAAYILMSVVTDNADAPVLLQLIAVLLFIVHVLPMLAVGVRRIHDIDKTGWMMLISLIPLVSLVMIYFWAQPGTEGPNAYGPDPYGNDGLIRGPAKFPTAVPIGPAGSVSVSAAAPSSSRDVVAEIERLVRLRSEGALSETEFDVLKAKVMNASA